jgi:hypothetical protein
MKRVKDGSHDRCAIARVLLFAGFAFGAIQQDGTSVNGDKLRSLLGIDLQISALPTRELDGKSVHHSDSRRSSGYRWKTDQGCSEPIRRGRDVRICPGLTPGPK